MSRSFPFLICLLLIILSAESALAWYHAPLGRWVSRDPIGYEGGTPNLCEYASSSPVIRTDSSGTSLDCSPDCPQATGNPTEYGCYCGEGTNHPDPQPNPIDPLDGACQKHDDCYGRINPPCKGKRIQKETPFGPITIGFEPDPRPECRACDKDLCRQLNVNRCNRYDPSSPEHQLCKAYIWAAEAVFKCQQFGMKPG